tara:strand:- start:543 stop:1082 length:540 start_codon:yes stop_codon:yes gene_type:complete
VILPFSTSRLRVLITGLGLTGLFLASGCSNYHLGTKSAPLLFKSLFIAPVVNTAAVPQAVVPVSTAIRTALMNNPRVQLSATSDTADAIIEVTLVKYGRDFTAVLPTDTALARKFDITLTAICTLTHQGTGRVLFANREIKSTRQIFVDGGQNPAEYQVMPQLADDLARRIAHAVLDVW